ncbi:hypothetical protein PHLCEN_2v3748 [Hermanssonia centrifuga]|uniref:Terpenoid synthase n=1 Tax=Hermanssonia centrifuga TaxID=98765 RepID=A0A2R6QBQ0_9APHY|nr:hypothetical protein PHLCEN_2v3748 [Hermanssonia centrifuga]
MARNALSAFMQRANISIRGLICDPDGVLERRVREIVEGWDLGVPPKRYEPHLMASVNISAAAYGHTPLDVQVHIALYTLMAICVDDFNVDTHALQEFSTRLHAGLPQLHPVLEYLVYTLHHMSDFYLPYACKVITTASTEFVDMTLFEKETEDMPLSGDALRWAEHKRVCNGIGEAYALFIYDKFSFPDIATHIQANTDIALLTAYMNDIFSFYKEELAGETRNFIHDRAVTTNKSVSAALTDTVDEIVAAAQTARRILQGQKEKDVLGRFMAGYAAFHFHSTRYHLKDLMGSELT